MYACIRVDVHMPEARMMESIYLFIYLQYCFLPTVRKKKTLLTTFLLDQIPNTKCLTATL